jgi:multidrug efflux pump subunit AcrB
LENIRIRDNQGQQRPLTEVAEISFSRQMSEIKRMNQKRAITVSADVDPVKGNARNIIAQMQNVFLPELVTKYRQEHGVSIMPDWEGEQAQTIESINSMFVGFGIAMAGMYIMLIFQFRSYVQAFIIMAIIPYAWLGAVLGHYLVGIELTLFSFFGLVALTGVVVNDSIVLIDFINRQVRGGMPLHEALSVSGKRRFRPILLTSLTTIAGLLPILYERSMQAQVIIPMAVSLAFGLMATTFLALIMVPVLYQIYGIIISWFGHQLYEGEDLDEGGGEQGEHASPSPPTPALEAQQPYSETNGSSNKDEQLSSVDRGNGSHTPSTVEEATLV